MRSFWLILEMEEAGTVLQPLLKQILKLYSVLANLIQNVIVLEVMKTAQ